ncbi:MAG TPA: hypothetical protein VFX72_08360, partial [Usitatibacteraceae bacterium]|nr:hypothetical protein [Usitatibacteraceae bacterium]
MLHIEYLSLDDATDYLRGAGPGILGVMGFPTLPGECGADVPSACVAAASLGTGVDAPALCEVWVSEDPVRRGIDGGVRYAIAGEFLFGVVSFSEGAGAIRELAERAYGDIFAMLAKHEYPHAVRFWNYLPRINELEGGLERYRHFNIGRGAAFEAAGRFGAE